MKFTKYIIFIFIIPIYCQFGKNIVQYQTFDWHYIQSEHFDVYYYDTDVNAQYVAKESVRAYENISNAMGWKLKNRVPIIIYNSHNDFQQTNVIDMYMPEGVGGVTELYKNRVVIPYDGINKQFKNVIHHELVHAFINDYIYKGSMKNIQNKNDVILIPLWMNEGLAEFLASDWDAESDMWIRDLVINGEQLPKLNELNGYLAYRGGQSIWQFIVEELDQDYLNKKTPAPTIIATIFESIAISTTLNEALKESIGMGLEDLELAWHRYLKSEYWPDINNRQYISDIAIPVIDSKKNTSSYNIAPSISPDGSQIAYYSNKDGLMSLYIIPSDCNKCSAKSTKKIIRGGMSIDFEELNILKPGISWSNDSKKIIISSQSKGQDVLFIVDINSKKKEKIILNDTLKSIFQPAWNPINNDIIAFIGCNENQSDIYTYNLQSHTLVQITNDIFTDKEISWSNDGTRILFSSDRNGAIMGNQYDLYSIDIESQNLIRLTDTTDNEYYPISVYSDSLIVFISDQNGINNIHILNYDDTINTSSSMITNLFTGVKQLSGIDNQIFFTSLENKKFGIYKLDSSLFKLRQDSVKLNEVAKWKTKSASYDFTVLNHSLDKKRTNYRNYIFQSELFRDYEITDSTSNTTVSYLDSTGNYISQKYKTKFSLDIGQLSVGFGVSNQDYVGGDGMAVFQFSDVLGDHKIYLSTALTVNFKRSDYALAYRYLPKLIDWTLLFSHDAFNTLGNQYVDVDNQRTYSMQSLYQNIRFSLNASRPLSRFNRFDFSLNHYLMLVSDELYDITFYNDLISSKQIHSEQMSSLGIKYVWDNTRWFYTYPNNGSRFYLKYKTVPTPAYDASLATIDGRFYKSLSNGISLLFRNFAGHTWGDDRQNFYLGSAPSLYNSNPYATQYYNDYYNSRDYSNTLMLFNFSEHVMPIRGVPFMYKNGDNVAMFNFELRAPFLLYYFPAIKWLGQINGILFLDLGVAWNSNSKLPSITKSEHWINREENNNQQGWVMSYGWGPRFIFLGLPFQINYAWQYNPITGISSSRRYEVTIGFDL